MPKTQDYLKVLAEPLRLRILYLLRQTPLSVGELTQILKVSQPNVSHHLKALKALQLVGASRQGTAIYYFSPLDPPLPPKIKNFFLPLWQNLVELALELDEVALDRKELASVIAKRPTGLDHHLWELWRSLQPDIPFTHEVLQAGLPKAKLAVDIGCGDGNFLKLLKQTHQVVLGLDLSLRQLWLAQKQQPTFLLQADALALPLRDQIADSVYLRMTLQFLANIPLGLREAWRVVACGGCLSIIDSARLGFGATLPKAGDFQALFPQGQLRHYRREGSLFLLSVERLAQS